VRFAVLGAGSWGTALGAHLARGGHAVRLWSREPEIARNINDHHENALYFPGKPLPKNLNATPDLAEAAEGAETVFLVIPSEFCREVCRALSTLIPPRAAIVSATKGLEIETLCRMTEVVTQEVPGHPIAVLSGPSFALEVLGEQPTAVVLASSDLTLAGALQRTVSSRTFRAYSGADVVGVELGGALKNVIAIAAGIIDGLGYGQNTVAALITRGLAEMTRLAVALGGRSDTLAGLAGLGDLVLTCTGGLSRNRRLGQALGRGKTFAEATGTLMGFSSGDEQSPQASETGQGRRPQMVAEGVRTTLAACILADRVGVEMPIAVQMRGVLYEGRPPRAAVDELMLRSLKRE